MKRFFLTFAALPITFALGIGLASLSFADHSTNEPSEIPIELTVDEDLNAIDPVHSLTFKGYGNIVDATNSIGKVCYSSFQASDGAILTSIFIYRIKNKRIARNRFDKEITTASKVIERDKYRVLFEKEQKFFLVRTSGEKPDSSTYGITIRIIEGTSLKHILDYEKSLAE